MPRRAQNARYVSFTDAVRLLDTGFCEFSQFGLRDPMDIIHGKDYRNPVIGPETFPVCWQSQIYFMRNRQNFQHFISHLKGKEQAMHLGCENLPNKEMNIGIIGQPISDKTQLAQYLSNEFGFTYFNLHQKVQQDLLEAYNFGRSRQSRRIEKKLKFGRSIQGEDQVDLIVKMLSPLQGTLKGTVFDELPCDIETLKALQAKGITFDLLIVLKHSKFKTELQRYLKLLSSKKIQWNSPHTKLKFLVKEYTSGKYLNGFKLPDKVKTRAFG